MDNLINIEEQACAAGWNTGHCASFDAKLFSAKGSIERANFEAAASKLGAFVKELRAQYLKTVNQQAYDSLTDAANKLIGELWP
jgi:hypothetical protein